MEIISSHSLFNSLNNGHPMIVADTRANEAFDKSHLRDSQNLPANVNASQISTYIAALLVARPLLKSVAMVFIFDDETEPADRACFQQELDRFIANISASQDEKFQRIHSIARLECAYPAFRSLYSGCRSLFLGTEEEPSQQGHPRVRCYPSEVIPGFLFLGDDRQATDACILKDLGITHIVDATGVEASRSWAASLDINYLHFDVEDSERQDLAQYFESAIAFISGGRREEKGRVFVHCRAGISRSTTFVLAYMLHSRTCESLRAALHQVMKQRPWVCPNPFFRKQLREYEASLGQPSFESDEAMKTFMQSYLTWYVGNATCMGDTPREQVAISTGLDGSVYSDEEFLRTHGAFAADTAATATVAKPKRPFLKRKEGKSTPS